MRAVLFAFITTLALVPIIYSSPAASSEDAAVSLERVTSLGRARDRASVPELIRAMGSTTAGIRREAAKALGEIKDARAVPALLNALGDADTNVRYYAAYALGEIKAPGTADGLIRALQDPNWGVRDQAAWALRELHDADIALQLTDELKAEAADFEHIMWILQHTGDKRCVAKLQSLLSASNTDVRLRAVSTLRKLDQDGRIPALIAALDDQSPRVRTIAAETLIDLGDERADAPLQALAASDPDESVRELAKQAMLLALRRGGIAALWPLDDGNAATARDMTLQKNDGEIKGCTVVDGKVGKALHFGKGQYVELGKPPALSMGGRDFTIMAWVKSETDNGVVVARGGAWCGFSLYIKDGVPKFGIRRGKEDVSQIAAGKDNVVGKWVHLSGAILKNRIELYVDGKLAATQKTAGHMPGDCGQGMEIGFDAGNSAAEICTNFEGIIDEVKAFQKALTPDELIKHGNLAQ